MPRSLDASLHVGFAENAAFSKVKNRGRRTDAVDDEILVVTHYYFAYEGQALSKNAPQIRSAARSACGLDALFQPLLPTLNNCKGQ